MLPSLTSSCSRKLVEASFLAIWSLASPEASPIGWVIGALFCLSMASMITRRRRMKQAAKSSVLTFPCQQPFKQKLVSISCFPFYLQRLWRCLWAHAMRAATQAKHLNVTRSAIPSFNNKMILPCQQPLKQGQGKFADHYEWWGLWSLAIPAATQANQVVNSKHRVLLLVRSHSGKLSRKPRSLLMPG